MGSIPRRTRFRSAAVPGLLLVTLSAVYLGCQREAPEKQRRLQAQEAARRSRAEAEPPSPAVLEQLRSAAQDFMTEHTPGVTVQGFSFTQMTPNLYLVGVNTTDIATGRAEVQQLSAERLRDARRSEDGSIEDHGDFLWVIDRLDAAKMEALAQRHGIAGEVASVRERHGQDASWGHRSWLDDYLLWHFLFHRPSPMGFGYGSGFMPQPMGYRFYAPQRPFQEADVRPYQPAAAPTGGHSSVFLSGQAWNPPRAADVPISGQAYGVSAQHGGFVGKTGLGGVSRGGFGAAGHGAAAGS
jgi:hypothetical protein